jgi:hypothetical protein
MKYLQIFFIVFLFLLFSFISTTLLSRQKVQAKGLKPSKVSSVPSGQGTWILYCRNGWPTYSKNDTYLNYQGVKRQKDLFLYGHFWVYTSGEDMGKLYEYPDKTIRDCLDNAISTVHAKGGKVYGVLAIDMDPGNATQQDVIDYVKAASEKPELLQPIVDKVKEKGYDGVINDIEWGDWDNPSTTTAYNASLQKMLHAQNSSSKLGVAIAANLPHAWQDWSQLNKAADFFIMMALDHYPSSSKKPFAITDVNWLKELFTMSSRTLSRLDTVMWELPEYCKLWKFDPEQNKWILVPEKDSNWCDYRHTQAHLKEIAALPKNMITKDKSKDPHNPYVAYKGNDGAQYMLFYETPASLEYMSKTLQALNSPYAPCVKISFWDFDAGDLDTRFLNNKVKFC